MKSANLADLEVAEAQTRRLARTHYENFIVAGTLLPRPMRQPFYNIYAFCRTADDAADESINRASALEKLSRLRDGLAATYAGHPPCAAPPLGGLFLALHKTTLEFSIPQQPFDDLLDAFVQDQSVTRYETDQTLLEYCRRSANPVGRILLAMDDCRDETSFEQSDAICTGLQLINFWQDIARDRTLDRIYIPLDRLGEKQISPADLDAPTASRDVRDLVLELCTWTETFFDRGAPLAGRVSSWLSPSVDLFVAGGREVIASIRRLDGDVLRVRPTVSKWSRMRMMAKTFLRQRVSQRLGKQRFGKQRLGKQRLGDQQRDGGRTG